MEHIYDTIILGAGINGCGIALEISNNNKSVLILEKSSIGSGTSSKSSRLIHGGLRYLGDYQFKLVNESLTDRQFLLTKYPDIVKMKSFYLPVYKPSYRPGWIVWLGLKIYDLLAGKHNSYRSSIVTKKEFHNHMENFKTENLSSVFQYYDAKTNDLTLTRRVADEAQSNGTKIIKHIHISKIINDKNQFLIETDKGNFKTSKLINATGPWIDEINNQYHFPTRYRIKKVSGIHLIFKGLLTNDLVFIQTKNRRIFFVIPEPENNQTIIGTTEREESGDVDRVKINDEDIDYLLENINRYLKIGSQIQRKDIIDQYIGVRPLVASSHDMNKTSRDYKIDHHQIGNTQLIHVFGGKLTTYPSLSKKVYMSLFTSLVPR